jgi:23S rRNA (uracil1939-C5)-methyltransferase
MSEPIRIARIAAGGDGVGRLPDGRVVLVPRTAPGDLVRIVIDKVEKRLVRARMSDLLEPGPDRVEPPCRHYRDDDCGGCQLQHLSPDAQRAARAAIVVDAMTRIAKVPLPPPPLTPADREWGYRSKISLAVSAGSRRRIGFRRAGRPGSVFDLDRCLIAADGINAFWIRLRAARDLLPATAERLVLRLDRAGGEHLIVETGEGPAWTGGAALAVRIAADRPVTIWWRPEGGAARVLAGAPTAYPATAFEQVNPTMGDRVRVFAVAQLGPVAGKRIWDLYAGIGETTALVAEAGGTVESVDADGTAVAEAARRQAGLGPRVARWTGRAERLVGSLGKPDAVIANPPRAGLDRAVVAAIRGHGPSPVVYLSCDPATLARDVGRLSDPATQGSPYRLGAVAGFDLFPQTAHLETVAVLEPR